MNCEIQTQTHSLPKTPTAANVAIWCHYSVCMTQLMFCFFPLNNMQLGTVPLIALDPMVSKHSKWWWRVLRIGVALVFVPQPPTPPHPIAIVSTIESVDREWCQEKSRKFSIWNDTDQMAHMYTHTHTHILSFSVVQHCPSNGLGCCLVLHHPSSQTGSPLGEWKSIRASP